MPEAWRYLMAKIKNRNKKNKKSSWTVSWEVNLVREKEDHALFLSTHTGLGGTWSLLSPLL